MAKTPDFINPTVPKTINTISGTAHYVKTEIGDEFGRWNDNYYTRDGYWVIHEGNHHHVYKIISKGKAPAAPTSARLPIIEQMRKGTLPNPYEIKESDIRRLLTFRSGDFGEVIPADVGKRVYLRKGILQMENTEQRDKRKGKGWRESPDSSGKAPDHRDAKLRAQAKHAQNTPMRRGSMGSPSDQAAIIRTLKENQKTHRKLTEKERDRMIDLWASAPLTYRPSIDDALMKLGLVQFWDNMPDAVENTQKPFYGKDGGVLPEWYDFKAERARYDAKRAAKAQEKYVPPHRVDVWEERDRLIITVYDANDKEVASWVDDDARQMFEDGFFDSKDLEQSVIEYLKDIKIIKGG